MKVILSVSFSSLLSHRNTVLLKGVEVTLRNEFPHDAQPKPNPTKPQVRNMRDMRTLTVEGSDRFDSHAKSLVLSTPTVILLKGISVKSCRDAPRL